jgi:hypothetical protein
MTRAQQLTHEHRRPTAQAARIARHLRPAAAALNMWVSAEAGVRSPAAGVLRPAVVVARGEPPYDGIADQGVVLIVELEQRLAERWVSPSLRAIWAPRGHGTMQITVEGRTDLPAGAELTVPGFPTLSMPGELLVPATEEAEIIDLGAKRASMRHRH